MEGRKYGGKKKKKKRFPKGGLYFRNILFYSLKMGQKQVRGQKQNICIVLFECLRSMVVLFVNSVNSQDKNELCA